MEATFDHNRLLKQIAKERLLPHGMVQQGKSSTFLYDGGWWTIIIEFQSSSFSRGTYLNIGVDFHFYPQDHFAFTYGYREKGFEAAEEYQQFTTLIGEYCDYTLAKVEELKTKFIDVYAALRTFRKASSNSGWDNFNLGVLYGIAGKTPQAVQCLRKVIKEKAEQDYELKRQQIATDVLGWLSDYAVFTANMKLLINQAREMKKLLPADLNNLQERKATHNSIGAIWRRLIRK